VTAAEPTPRDANGVALGFVRDEIALFRSGVQEQISAMRGDVAGLAGELRAYVTEQATALALLKHRADISEKSVDTLRTDTSRALETLRVELREEHARAIGDIETELADAKRYRAQLLIGLALAVIAAVLSWLPDILT
jgi:hypothetical protein